MQPLVGQLVRLDPLVPAHAAALAAATAEDPGRYTWSSAPIGEEAAAAYVERALAEAGAEPWAVVLDGRVVGSTRLCRFELLASGRPWACEVGYSWLAASAVGTGANLEAKRLLLGRAFDHHGVERVAAHADARNLRSRAALAKVGFRLDGVLRHARLGHDGEPRDDACFSLLDHEWPEVRDRLDEALALLVARRAGG
jgi:RimJ/RimL family protein N-acetyltransferase